MNAAEVERRRTDEAYAQHVRDRWNAWDRKKRDTDPAYRAAENEKQRELRARQRAEDADAYYRRYRGWRKSSGLRQFGLTIDEYDRLNADQDGRCAICGEPETVLRQGQPLALAVDHDHLTGEVRGLLCGNCNNGLGRYRDDPGRLRAAATYLDVARAKRLRIVSGG